MVGKKRAYSNCGTSFAKRRGKFAKWRQKSLGWSPQLSRKGLKPRSPLCRLCTGLRTMAPAIRVRFTRNLPGEWGADDDGQTCCAPAVSTTNDNSRARCYRRRPTDRPWRYRLFGRYTGPVCDFKAKTGPGVVEAGVKGPYTTGALNPFRSMYLVHLMSHVRTRCPLIDRPLTL